MDTQTKRTATDVITLPEAGVEGGPQKANPWLVVAVVVLSVAVVALGAGLIAATNDTSTPAPAPAVVDPAVSAALDGSAAALWRGDVPTTVTFYAVNGTLILANGQRFEGTAAISGWMNQATLASVKMARVSDVIGDGTFGAALYRYTSSDGVGYVLRVVTLDSDGKIVAEEQIERWPGA